jgi:uncharacterized membrane protein (UPF0182 family)
LVAASKLWTEVLWFRQLGFLNVFTTQWVAQIALFVIGALVMALVVWLSMWIAYKARPVYLPETDSDQVVGRYRSQFEPVRRPAMIVVPAVIGLFAAGNAAAQWENVLLAMNARKFGEVDPQFGLDWSFYVFQLPAIRFGVSFLMGAIAIGLVAAVVMNYLYGGIRMGMGGPKGGLTKAARLQLGLTAAVLCLAVAVQYFLDRYSMMYASGDRWDGALYTAVHANMPAKLIMACIAVFVAAMFVAAAWKGDWKLPATGLGLMVLSAAVVGWAYPSLIQHFSVDPSMKDKEAPYIQHNIDATRAAFDLEDVEVTSYSAKTDAEPGALREDADSTASIRLLDPTVVSPTFRQKEQNKQYYDFPSVLAVDRYAIGNEKRDTVIAVRDLKLSGLGDGSTWVNQHTVFTHGYGAVAAYGNTTDEQGWPSFYEYGIPSQGDLDIEQPRVYFGTTSPDYSIVGGAQGDQAIELDYPSDAEESGEVNNTYDGKGGPNVGSTLNKLLYALRFGSTNILFSDSVRPESQILYDRDPYVRVQKVAPYLTLDERVYPAVVDGRIVWVVDGYTTADSVPYAQHQSLDTTTVDTITARRDVAGINAIASERVNYLRNSVKAVVDAYDGSVRLYAWDAEDPVLRAWAAVYSNNLTPVSEISGDLMSHLRYPETMFKVQRAVLAKYHVTDAPSFFSQQDFWKTPADPTKDGDSVAQQPPYYLTMKMPTQEAATFSLSSTYILASSGQGDDRSVLKGFLAVNSETGNTPGEVDPDYGKMRLLRLPQGTSVAGPGQVQNTFVSDSTVKSEIRLLQDQGTEVIKGNLLTLPMGGGLLYVQPLYVQASSGTQFPSLQKVVVGFGEDVGVADTLTAALDAVFKGDAGAEAGDSDIGSKELDPGITGEEGEGGGASPAPSASASPSTPAPSASAPTPGASTPPSSGGGDLDQALGDLLDAIDAADSAMKAGDWEAYAKAQADLQAARSAVEAARNQAGG